MADEEKEKAEKLAAAKKRFEQHKKEQKKGKKAGKKKDEKPADAKADETTAAEEAGDGADNGELDNEIVDDSEQPEPAAQSSPQAQSKQRSASIKQGADGPQAEVQELYRKQAAKIEQLEKENKTLKEENEHNVARLSKTEEELEGLREGSSDIAELKTKAKEADRLSTELASVQRQLSQAQQVTPNPRRISTGPLSPSDLDTQLASKTSTIESLELEISNLRHQLTTSESKIAQKDESISSLTDRLTLAEELSSTTKSELDALKVSIAFPSDSSSTPDPAALSSKITVLESDLRTAQNSLTAASTRASQLEAKIEALTRLHREATSSSQAKDREISDLRAEARKASSRRSHTREASSSVAAAAEFELDEDETETGALAAKIRALEAENFDLKRGVWRERRAELQPGMHEDGANGDFPDYEDVDLGGGQSPRIRDERRTPGIGGGRQTSSFSDVINSGINAFTNRDGVNPRIPGGGGQRQGMHERKQSVGLMSDDGSFDEEAFRLAQEEEAKRRIERVKEVKRGLEQWRGWRVDFAELRGQQQQQHGMGGYGSGRGEVGPVFEI